MLIQLFLATVLLVGPYDSDQYQSKIEVPNGKTVALTAAAADSTEWRWTNPPADTNPQTWPDGKMFVLSTGVAGDYVIAEASASIVEEKIKQKLLLHLVKVLPPPGPPPGPGPVIPTPPLPDIPPDKDKLGLASWVRLHALSNVPTSDRPTLKKFADGCSSVASQIAAGVIKDSKAMDAELLARNREAAGSDREKWATLLIFPMSKKVSEAKLQFPQYQQALEEFALGLNLAAK